MSSACDCAADAPESFETSSTIFRPLAARAPLMRPTAWSRSDARRSSRTGVAVGNSVGTGTCVGTGVGNGVGVGVESGAAATGIGVAGTGVGAAATGIAVAVGVGGTGGRIGAATACASPSPPNAPAMRPRRSSLEARYPPTPDKAINTSQTTIRPIPPPPEEPCFCVLDCCWDALVGERRSGSHNSLGGGAACGGGALCWLGGGRVSLRGCSAWLGGGACCTGSCCSSGCGGVSTGGCS